MANPHGAKSTGKGRLYTWKNERFWSVTTLLSAVPKPALAPWAAREAAEFAVGNIKQINALIRKDQSDAAVQLIKGAPNRGRDRAAKLGTAVHEAVEALILDKPIPDYEGDIAAHMDHFMAFVRDWNVTFEASECQAYSRSEKHAGSFDFIATIPRLEEFGYAGPRCIGDVKTGKGVYPEAALQLSAYGNSEFIGLPNGEEVPFPSVDVGVVLHLRPNGYQIVPARIDAEVYRAFLYVREVWRFQNEMAEDVLGVPLTKESAA